MEKNIYNAGVEYYPNHCAWCFNTLKSTNKRLPAYGFIFCSPDCAFRHKEFEDQFRKRF